ncbi:MAG TPA: hypothetical protein VE569_07305, partial [Acidimicrobiia bacterium]|nr:hypothetical protein [Acidimicrobiia bacterium]
MGTGDLRMEWTWRAVWLVTVVTLIWGLIPSSMLWAVDEPIEGRVSESFRPDAYSVHSPLDDGTTRARITAAP